MKRLIYIALISFLFAGVAQAQMPNAAVVPGTDPQFRFKAELPDAVLYGYYCGSATDIGLGHSFYQGTMALGVAFPIEVATYKGRYHEYPKWILTPDISLVSWGTPDPTEFGMVSVGLESRLRSEWEGGKFEWRLRAHGDIRRNIEEFEVDPENPYNPDPALGHGGGLKTGFIVRPGIFDFRVSGSWRFYPESMYTFKKVYDVEGEMRFHVARPFWFGGGLKWQKVPKVASNEEVGYIKETPFASLGLTFNYLSIKGRILIPVKENYESMGFDASVEIPI